MKCCRKPVYACSRVSSLMYMMINRRNFHQLDIINMIHTSVLYLISDLTLYILVCTMLLFSHFSYSCSFCVCAIVSSWYVGLESWDIQQNQRRNGQFVWKLWEILGGLEFTFLNHDITYYHHMYIVISFIFMMLSEKFNIFTRIITHWHTSTKK